jgi:hypothetical protein
MPTKPAWLCRCAGVWQNVDGKAAQLSDHVVCVTLRRSFLPDGVYLPCGTPGSAHSISYR